MNSERPNVEDRPRGLKRIVFGITTGSLSTFLERRGVYVALAIVVLISALLSPAFYKFSNILNVLRAAAVLGIVSIGQTIVILGGGIKHFAPNAEGRDVSVEEVARENGFRVVMSAEELAAAEPGDRALHEAPAPPGHATGLRGRAPVRRPGRDPVGARQVARRHVSVGRRQHVCSEAAVFRGPFKGRELH